jgi:hypothetical protein
MKQQKWKKPPLPTDPAIVRIMRRHESAARTILSSGDPSFAGPDNPLRYSRAAGHLAAVAKLTGETSGQLFRRLKLRQSDTTNLCRSIARPRQALATINRKRNPGCVRGDQCTCTDARRQRPRCPNWHLTDPSTYDIQERLPQPTWAELMAPIKGLTMAFERTDALANGTALSSHLGMNLRGRREPIPVVGGEWRRNDVGGLGWRFWRDPAPAVVIAGGFERTIEWVRTATLARIIGMEPGACAVDGAIQVCAGEWRQEGDGWRFWRDPAWDEDAAPSEKGKAEAAS